MYTMVRLKELRKNANLTLNDVSSAIKVANSTLSQYENGKRQPDFDTLQKLADFFNVTIDYLLGKSKNPTPTDEYEREIEYLKKQLLIKNLELEAEKTKTAALEAALLKDDITGLDPYSKPTKPPNTTTQTQQKPKTA